MTEGSGLSRNERRVLAALGEGPATAREIAVRADMIYPAVRTAILTLGEEYLGVGGSPLPGKGLITCDREGRFSRAEEPATEPPLAPEVGRTYLDPDGGRLLEVTEIVEGDRLGREVRGRLRDAAASYGGGNGSDAPFTTDLKTFRKIWTPA